MRKTVFTIAALSLACFVPAQAQAAGDGNAQGNREGTMQLIKNCDEYVAHNGSAGSWCAITESSLPEIPPNTHPNSNPPYGTVVYYTMAAGIVPNMIDSPIVLDAGHGNRAVGRCTFDGATNTGLCDYVDGTGTLAGFSARLVVTPDPPGSLTTNTYFLNGPYVFKNTNEPPS